MPLEDLTGTKYIEDLNPLWPIGGEPPVDGDNHIRGIKNVLQVQFPNLGAEPILLTAAQINAGSTPAGTVTAFYQASAPDGWSRVTGITQTYGTIIAATADAGGSTSGTDDPGLNNKVPSHTHSYSGTTGPNNATHSHNGTIASGGAHTHATGTNTGGPGTERTFHANAGSGGITNADGSHTHAISISTQTANHEHVYSGSTGANGSAANWAPRVMTMILCERDAPY